MGPDPRALYRYLDADETFPVEQLNDVTDAHGVLFKRHLEAVRPGHHSMYSQVRRVLALARQHHGMPQLYWPECENPDTDPGDLPDRKAVRRLAHALRLEAGQIKAMFADGVRLADEGTDPRIAETWHVEADRAWAMRHLTTPFGPFMERAKVEGFASDLSRHSGPRLVPLNADAEFRVASLGNQMRWFAPCLDDTATFFALFLLRSGWNPATALNLDVSDDARWVEDHPLRSDLKVLKAVKDRSGAYQVAVSMERPEYHPYRIVRFMIARTEPLRRHLREQIVQIDERLRTGRGGLELRKQRERLAEMARSPWLYASRGKGVGSVSALSGQWVTTVTQIMRAVIEKHDVKGDDGRRLFLSAKDARHVWIGFAYEESGYQWLVAKLAAGHKGIETLRRYLNKRRWKSHGEQRIARLQNAIWAELGERRPVDGAVLRWLVEHGHITEVERQRLADWRRSRSRIGMRCRDPRSPPPDISPDHPAGSVCRVQRCTMCHHGFVFDDSLDGLAMRCAELVFIQKNMPFESWSRSTFPEEMEGVGEALALFPADEVERRVAAWTNKFESGEAAVFQFEGAYGEAAHAED